jgi:hypothetical protein
MTGPAIDGRSLLGDWKFQVLPGPAEKHTPGRWTSRPRSSRNSPKLKATLITNSSLWLYGLRNTAAVGRVVTYYRVQRSETEIRVGPLR